MRILIDTHVALGVLWGTLAKQYLAIARLLSDPATIGFVSVASLWEISIKTQLGKLDPGMPIEHIAAYLKALGLMLLPIEAGHVVTVANPEPNTRDPFDRLLLAQCQVENLRLATVDRALVAHPLALKT